jgi:hypothetical protein
VGEKFALRVAVAAVCAAAGDAATSATRTVLTTRNIEYAGALQEREQPAYSVSVREQ